jgi:hypothetical protein
VITARALYHQCRRLGISLAANGGALIVSAPAHLTLPLVELAAVKLELLALLVGDYFGAAFELLRRLPDPAQRMALAERFDQQAQAHHANDSDWARAVKQAYIDLARTVEREPDNIDPQSGGRVTGARAPAPPVI